MSALTFARSAVRTSGHLLRSRVTNSTVTSKDQVPDSVGDISPEWMSDVLSTPQRPVRVTGLTPGGGSFGSHERRQLKLDYAGDSDGLPATVFTKTLPSLATRMLVGYLGHARFEMLFYTRVRPQLSIETPECYHSATDKRRYAAVHVLEDLSESKKATFCDHETPLTLSDAEGMVDLLADLHGPYYDSPLLDEHRWIPAYSLWFREGVRRARIDKHHRIALRRAKNVVPLRLWERHDEIWPATLAVADLHDQSPHTLLHNDVHIANWYRTGAGAMGLLDWQLLSRGHWARDLSYALSTALPIEQRRAWERQLVSRYVTRMADHHAVRLDPAEAFVAYRQQMFHSLSMWTQVLSHPRTQPNSFPRDMTLTLISRIATAIDDLDCLETV